MESFTHTRDDYFAYIAEVEEYGGQSQEGTKKEKATSQHRRFIKGVQDEKKLAEILKDRIERIEKEEAVRSLSIVYGKIRLMNKSAEGSKGQTEDCPGRATTTSGGNAFDANKKACPQG